MAKKLSEHQKKVNARLNESRKLHTAIVRWTKKLDDFLAQYTDEVCKACDEFYAANSGEPEEFAEQFAGMTKKMIERHQALSKYVRLDYELEVAGWFGGNTPAGAVKSRTLHLENLQAIYDEIVRGDVLKPPTKRQYRKYLSK